MKEEQKTLTEKQIEAAINKARKQLCSLMRAHMKKNKIAPYKLGLITGMQPNHVRKKLSGKESMDLGTFFKLAMGLKLNVRIDAACENNTVIGINICAHPEEKRFTQGEVDTLTGMSYDEGFKDGQNESA